MKQVILLIATALTVFPTCEARAEGGCPPGQMPYTATPPEGSAASLASCGPIPSRGPSIQWESRWGAIASDEANGITGAVDSRKGKRRANKGALSECQARGGKECKVMLSYHDQCVVIIQGNAGAAYTHAASIEYATQLGMEACRKRDDSDCHVYYEACSLPVRVR